MPSSSPLFKDLYCTTTFAKKFAGDVQGIEDDVVFSAMIEAASRVVENVTNRYWGPSASISGERVRSSRIIGSSYNIFYTEWAPVISVQSLVDDVNTWVEDTDYVCYPTDGKVELYGARNYLQGVYTVDAVGFPRTFSRKPGAVQISYTVGVKGSSSGSTMVAKDAPADIQLVTAAIAGLLYKDPERLGLASNSAAGDQLNYDIVNALPRRYQTLLNLRTRNIP